MLINNLHIQNFRLFKDLKIEKIGRVNLIVGANNVGKTSLLEAVMFVGTKSYQSSPYIKNIISLILTNRLAVDIQMLGNSQFMDTLTPNEAGIYYKNIQKIWDIQKTDYFDSLFYEKKDALVSFKAEAYSKSNEPIVVDNSFKKTELVDKISKNILNTDSTFTYKIKDAVFIPARNISQKQLYEAWEAIQSWDFENSDNYTQTIILKGLQIVDKRVEAIRFDTSNGLVQIKARVEGVALNINNMGDGIQKVLTMLLLAKQAEQALLIDEIENGLHYGIQDKVWEMLFFIAKELDIQIFATTHSKDCITGFWRACEKFPEAQKEAVVIRLSRNKNEDIISNEFEYERLEAAIESDIELR